MAVLLEASHTQRDSLLGIVADLEKAFNGIPACRYGLHYMHFSARQLLSVDGAALSMPSPMLQGEGSHGDPIPSTCGYPEGCALSVGAMAVLNLLLDHWMTSNFRDFVASLMSTIGSLSMITLPAIPTLLHVCNPLLMQ